MDFTTEFSMFENTHPQIFSYFFDMSFFKVFLALGDYH